MAVAIFFQFRQQPFDDFHTTFIISHGYLWMAILWMPFNWGVESIKWKLALQPICNVSYVNSIKSILSGVSIGFITPARVGDYGGRMIHLPSEARIPSIVVTFYTSIIQNSVHIFAGLILSYSFLLEYWNDIIPKNYTFIIVLLFLTFGLIFLFNFPKIILKLLTFIKTSKFSEIQNHLVYLKSFTLLFTLKLFLLSILRYSIYLLQYVLIMKSLGVDLTFLELISGIALIYILQSGIPLPPMISFLGRTEIAILVWSQFHVTAYIALIASILLWFINLVVPAITGYAFILLNKKVL